MSSLGLQLAQESVVYEPSETLRPVAVQSAVGTPRRFFVPREASRKHFEHMRLVTILQNVSPSSNEHECSRLANAIRSQGYLSVFLILKEIDRAEYIGKFLKSTLLHDSRLPFENPRNFPHGVNLQEFRARQHSFDAQVFYKNMDVEFLPEQILPIKKKDPMLESGSDDIFRIEIHPEFDQLQTLPDAKYPHVYVLKTFHGPEGERDFLAEVKSYQATQAVGMPTPSLIQFYGSYKYQDECNMILEYADGGTLEQFLEAQRPPMRPKDIAAIWQNQLEVSKALQRIHRAQGCHQDVTPRNLVVRKPARDTQYNSNIKLIDFNHSHFGRDQPGQEIFVKDECGAGEYSAPDCHRKGDHDQQTERYVPQNIDVWSLGCVWLIVAVWMTEGLDGLRDFHAKRCEEIKTLPEDSMPTNDIAYFHDGYNILECVEDRLQYIASEESAADSVTKAICQHMIRGMLEGDHQARTTSTQLVEDCQAFVAKNFRQPITSNTTPGLVSRRTTMPIESLKRVGTAPTTASYGRPSSSHHPLRSSEPILEDTLSDTPRVLSFDKAEEEVVRQSTHTSNRQPSQRTSNPDVLESIAALQLQGRQLHRSDSNNPNSDEDGYHKPLSSSPEQISKRRQSSKSTGLSGSLIQRTGSDPRPNSRHKQGESISRDLPVHTRGDSKVESSTGSSSSAKRPQYAPILDVPGAASWMAAKKKGDRTVLPHGQELKGQLRARDHVFILDDGFTMMEYLPSAIYILEILSFIVEEDDPDGVELHFTNSKHHITSTESARLVALANDLTPGGKTRPETVLRPILESYQKKLEHSLDPTKVRPLSIYILTDGRWEGLGENPIVLLLPLINTLADFGLPRETVGVQFISFGNQTTLMDQMDEMKDLLDLQLDIVDRTESNGNVWKMLLGSIDERFDNIPS